MAEKKVKLSKKDLECIQKQLGYHRSGVEYEVTIHNKNVYKSEGV